MPRSKIAYISGLKRGMPTIWHDIARKSIVDFDENKANKVSGGTSGNIISLTSDGDIQDSGIASSNVLEPSDIIETTNQVLVLDNGNGTVTLYLPQDIHLGASPEFTGLTISGLTENLPLEVSATQELINVYGHEITIVNESSAKTFSADDFRKLHIFDTSGGDINCTLLEGESGHVQEWLSIGRIGTNKLYMNGNASDDLILAGGTQLVNDGSKRMYAVITLEVIAANKWGPGLRNFGVWDVKG